MKSNNIKGFQISTSAFSLTSLALAFLVFSNSIAIVAASSEDSSSSCFLGCQKCQNSDNHCEVCFSGRGEINTNTPINGLCECQENKEERFESTCEDKGSSLSIVRNLSQVLIIFLIISISLLAISGNHLIAFVLYDNLQLLSSLGLLNLPFPGGTFALIQSMQSLNIDYIFGRLFHFCSLQSSTATTQSCLSIENNDQLIQSSINLQIFKYTSSFLYNAGTLLVFYAIIGVVMGTFVFLQKQRRYKKGLIYSMYEKRYTVFIRLITITISELTFYALLQAKNPSTSTGFSVFSLLLAILIFIGIASLVFFLIFSLNWTITSASMIQPKYATYFDRLKDKNVFNRNIICVQVAVKILFAAFNSVGVKTPSTALAFQLILYICYSVFVIIFVRLTKKRLMTMYRSICLFITLLISVLLVYNSYTGDSTNYSNKSITSNRSELLIIAWLFNVLTLLFLLALTAYAIAENVASFPVYVNYVRQLCLYIQNKDDSDEINDNEFFDHENEGNYDPRTSKLILNNLEVPLASRRRIAAKQKKQQHSVHYGAQKPQQWFDNPLYLKDEGEISKLENNFNSSINFELNESQLKSSTHQSTLLQSSSQESSNQRNNNTGQILNSDL